MADNRTVLRRLIHREADAHRAYRGLRTARRMTPTLLREIAEARATAATAGQPFEPEDVLSIMNGNNKWNHKYLT